MFGKKPGRPKKIEEVEEPEEVLPQKEEVAKEADLVKKEVYAVNPEPTEGTFSLNTEEMALAVNALASSEEFKIYQRVLVGQKITGIIQAYQEYVQQNKEAEKTDQ